MKRSTVWGTGCVLLAFATVFTVLFGVADRQTTAVLPAGIRTVVIDPGHGGPDGGAVAADGTLEKEINFSVAQDLRDILYLLGFEVTMTRTGDTDIDPQGSTVRQRKVSDIRNRTALCNRGDLAVSIHQNQFSQTQYSGTQVFYPPRSEESRQIAEAVQRSVVSLLQPDNRREVKAGAGVYLLEHATVPTVLVECGFLSNEAERERLKTASYQQAMAFAVAGGIAAAL